MRFAYVDSPPPVLDSEWRGLSEEADEVIRQFCDAYNHYLFPITRETPAQRFNSLASSWKDDTKLMSSTTDMVLHPAYQEIIGMGSPAVPLLLVELGTRPEHWFWALKSITGVDPVPPSSQGRLKKMAEAWLAWGREEGYDV